MTEINTSALIDALSQCRDAFPAPKEGSPIESYWAGAMADPLSVPEYLKQIALKDIPVPEIPVVARTEVDSTALQDAIGVLRICGYHEPADRLEATACRLVDPHKSLSNITSTTGRTTNFSLTERKTNGILEKGYKLSGYVLQKEETGERAIIELSAVRWMSKAAMFDLMHQS
jgi:hypothetical protein